MLCYTGIEDDENIDYDGEIEDNGDEMANHNRRFEKDTTPSKANVIYSKVSDEIRRFHQGINDDAGDFLCLVIREFFEGNGMVCCFNGMENLDSCVTMGRTLSLKVKALVVLVPK